jgi:hypothetical protein
MEVRGGQWRGAGSDAGEGCKVGERLLLGAHVCAASCLRVGHTEMRDVFLRKAVDRRCVFCLFHVGVSLRAQWRDSCLCS